MDVARVNSTMHFRVYNSIYHIRFGESGYITKISGVSFCDLSKYPPHDLSRPSLRQTRDDTESVYSSMRPNLLPAKMIQIPPEFR